MRIAVLTYHSHNISGSEYHSNDHVAFAQDLRTITEIRGRVVPLQTIVDLLRTGLSTTSNELLVGLTFDDGPIFDIDDFIHPVEGRQRSFMNIMLDFKGKFGAQAQPTLHATSFVIASKQARVAMEKAVDCGFPDLADWLSDSWWNRAFDSDLLAIGNHSWDHVHHAVPEIAITESHDQRDNFELVNNYIDADREIRRATAFIKSMTHGRCSFFAFPFGQANDYLVHDYFPTRREEHEMEAAFGTGGQLITGAESVWNIPRLVCGLHWKSSNQLRALLNNAGDE